MTTSPPGPPSSGPKRQKTAAYAAANASAGASFGSSSSSSSSSSSASGPVLKCQLAQQPALVRAIQVNPMNVAFGNVRTGQASLATRVTVTSTGNAPLTIGNVALAGGHVNQFVIPLDGATGQVLAPGQSRTVDVTFQPTAVGVKGSTLSIPSDASAGSPTVVQLAGTGTAPAITVLPVNLAFGDVVRGQISANRTVTITSSGTAPLVLGNIALTGGDLGQFATDNDVATGRTLAPGQSTTIDVNFRPTSGGAKASALRILSNDAGSPTDVQVGGTGVAVVLAVQELTFAGNQAIKNDYAGTAIVGPHWQQGAAAKPVCYLRNENVRVTATFNVTTAPLANTTVNIRGRATLGAVNLAWTQANLAVANNAVTVATNAMNSNLAIPNTVGCYAPATITWEYQAADGVWRAAGQTQLPLYALLAAPRDANKLYLMLVDNTCLGAHGAATQRAVVQGVFTRLTPPHPNPNVTRNDRPGALTYWGDPTPGAGATNTTTLMARGDGSGQCGAWAELLIDMYGIHGIAGIKVDVRSWHTRQNPATLIGMQVLAIPGQNKVGPPRLFAGHFIVRDPVDNQYYDPSYGAGPYNDVAGWKAAALTYTFVNPNAVTTFQDNITVTKATPLPVTATAGAFTLPAGTTVMCVNAANIQFGAPVILTPSAGFTVTPPMGVAAALPRAPYLLLANHVLAVPANGTITFANQTAGFQAPNTGCTMTIPANTNFTIPANIAVIFGAGLEFTNGVGFDIAFWNVGGNALLEHG